MQSMITLKIKIKNDYIMCYNLSDFIIYYYFEIYYNFTFGNPVLAFRW